MIFICKVWFQYSSQLPQQLQNLGSFGGSAERPYGMKLWMEFKLKWFISCFILCQPLVLLHKANPNIPVNVSALHEQCQCICPYIDAVPEGPLPMSPFPCWSAYLGPNIICCFHPELLCQQQTKQNISKIICRPHGAQKMVKRR